MTKAYLGFAGMAFKMRKAYRVEFLSGIVNTIIVIFVNIAIWRAIYEEDEMIAGVQFKMVVTYIVLSFLIQSIFAMNDFFIANKIHTGTISSDFLKPVNFRLFVLSSGIGDLLFKLLFEMTPALIFSVVVFRILPPFSASGACYFAISLVFSYLMLYHLNFIIWISSFWFYQINSLVIIKDAVILILSGALVPLWFFPDWIFQYINFLPFTAIYYGPISIYLGRFDRLEIFLSIGRQFVWLVIFWGIGRLIWKKATFKMVVQGG